MALTQILLIAGAIVIIVGLGSTWVLRDRLRSCFQLHRWPANADLVTANEERARRRSLRKNVLTAKKSLKAAQRVQDGRVKAQEQQVRLAKATRTQAITQAQAGLSAAELNHAAKVREAQQRLELWQTPGPGPKLGTYRDVTLFQHQVRSAQGSASTLGTKATVDTAGNLAVTRRVTLTRVVFLGVVGGLLFKKKDKHDVRELYLLLETPDFASVTNCDPKEGPRIRQFAAKINTAALQESQFVAQRPTATRRYQKELAAAQHDQAEIQAAQLQLQQVEADLQLTNSVDTAQGTLAATLSDTRALEAARARLSEAMLAAAPNNKTANGEAATSK